MRLDTIEIELQYDDPKHFNITLSAITNSVNFTENCNTRKEITEAFVLEAASAVLISRNLPSLDEILQEHYPEALL